ncbi:hypothetical protein SLS53_007960 [Cytospora paraplurivora]|uniref:Uncharacterized protein n=1 Tax=Cytospora paraplurivora TaxID=2898453 RepID=A0AAN9TZ83_9PEZI
MPFDKKTTAGKKAAAPTPTPQAVLHKSMESAVVIGVVIEALGNEETLPADPAKEALGKKKNHWVLRLLIKNVFKYISQNGEEKRCASVRVSVETDDNTSSLKCPTLTLRPVANSYEFSRSALAHFNFKLLKGTLTVQHFVKVAEPLLPFEYVIVAKSMTASSATAGSGGRGGSRDVELNLHPNGCRDFVAQWFYLLHKAGYVDWQCLTADHPHPKGQLGGIGGVGRVAPGEEFHRIIGKRYSAKRVDLCPISMARFPTKYKRQIQVDVMMESVASDGAQPTRMDPKGKWYEYRFELPYETQKKKVEVFNKTR